MSKRVLCFGDSNTFGWIGTLSGPALRFPPEIRWTGRLSALLGPDWIILEEGLGGRTLNDDFTVGSGIRVPGAGLSGKDYLPACLLSHLPLDAVVIMLGSNDMKSALGKSEFDIADGVAELADIVLSFPWEGLLDYAHPKLLIISPPHIGQRKMALAGDRYVDAPRKSRALAKLYREVADRYGASFLDAASCLTDTPAGEAHGPDGMHLSEDDHAKLAQAIANTLKNMFF